MRRPMIIDKSIEKQIVSEEMQGMESDCRTNAVKLVEMGPVSVETKGVVVGFEIGFLPRS
jgi:hypothetical protein